MTATVIDLSHVLYDGMPVYPGLPRPTIELHLEHGASRARYEQQAEFGIGRCSFVGNTGTYLDSPYHRYADAPDVSALPLDRLVNLATAVVDARAEAGRGRCLEPSLAAAPPLAGRAVLVRTGWDERWGTAAYWEPGPYLGSGIVQELVRQRPALVGVDFWNVDDPSDPRRPAHTTLLGAGIPIVEHLRALGDVPAGARCFIVPLAVRGAPSMPVRAFALSDRAPAQRARQPRPG
jgi:kynurenine formamidase